MASFFIKSIFQLFFMGALLSFPIYGLAQKIQKFSQIRIVVGFPAGATTDVVTRLLAQKLSQQMNIPVIADNKPGAESNIAAEIVSKAPADGQTLLLNTPSILLSRVLGMKMGYDLIKDLEPIALFGSSPYVLVVHPSLPVKTINEFNSYLKVNPNKYNYGSASSLTYFATLLFLDANNIKALHVNYKGGGPATIDLVGGRLQFLMTGQTAVMPMIKDNRLKPIALTSLNRSSLLPEIPTLNETVMPGFEMGTWFGIMAPIKTNKEIILRLNQEISKAAEDQNMKKRLEEEGVQSNKSSPEDYQNYIQKELKRWTDIAVKMSDKN